MAISVSVGLDILKISQILTMTSAEVPVRKRPHRYVHLRQPCPVRTTRGPGHVSEDAGERSPPCRPGEAHPRRWLRPDRLSRFCPHCVGNVPFRHLPVRVRPKGHLPRSQGLWRTNGRQEPTHLLSRSRDCGHQTIQCCRGMPVLISTPARRSHHSSQPGPILGKRTFNKPSSLDAYAETFSSPIPRRKIIA